MKLLFDKTRTLISLTSLMLLYSCRYVSMREQSSGKYGINYYYCRVFLSVNAFQFRSFFFIPYTCSLSPCTAGKIHNKSIIIILLSLLQYVTRYFTLIIISCSSSFWRCYNHKILNNDVMAITARTCRLLLILYYAKQSNVNTVSVRTCRVHVQDTGSDFYT